LTISTQNPPPTIERPEGDLKGESWSLPRRTQREARGRIWPSGGTKGRKRGGNNVAGEEIVGSARMKRVSPSQEQRSKRRDFNDGSEIFQGSLATPTRKGGKGNLETVCILPGVGKTFRKKKGRG